MPTIKGVKSPAERFAGADDTYTIEALMQNGWALQSGTSHFLGQNFARAFDVYYQTEKEVKFKYRHIMMCMYYYIHFINFTNKYIHIYIS